MYLMMDALADGGVYAGVPKDIALKLTAHTMIVSRLVAAYRECPRCSVVHYQVASG